VRYVNGANNPAAGLIPAAPGNENLRPERGTEFEGGFDAAFLKGRASIEFTTYTKRTTDALLSLASAPSSGFTASQFINFGAIRNSGTELGVRVQPVATRPLSWDVNFNYSTNNNRLTKLTRPGISTIGVSNVYAGTGATQRVREGYPVAAFWAADAKRKPDGSLDLTATNALQVDTAKYIGPMTPTREGTLATTFTFFGRLRLYALADFHLGHFLFNAKDRARSQGLLDQRLNTPGVTAIDTAYYTSGAILTPWVQRADYAKFRDLSLSFTIPERLLRRAGVSNAVLTVAGRNLGFLYKKYPGMDPEVSYVGQSSFLTGRADFLNMTRIDSYATPMTRRITTSINLSF
jgi:hypothetical protein